MILLVRVVAGVLLLAHSLVHLLQLDQNPQATQHAMWVKAPCIGSRSCRRQGVGITHSRLLSPHMPPRRTVDSAGPPRIRTGAGLDPRSDCPRCNLNRYGTFGRVYASGRRQC